MPEQSILFDRTRQTKLDGFSPADSVGSDLWENACWVKMTNDFGLTRVLWEAFIDVNNFTRLSMVGGGGAEKLVFEAQIAGVVQAEFTTGRFIYDPSAWYHIDVQFDRVGGNLDLFLNGVLYDDYNFGTTPTVANVAGYAWMDSGANHNVGGDDGNTVGFSGFMADFYASAGAIQGVTAFGVVNSIGTWTRIAPVFVANSNDFYLTFGRTADLGEDFSGNSNDFPNHVNGGSADQADDWPERNYCTIDITDPLSIGVFTEGALVIGGGGNGRVTMRPAPNTGVFYYELNGVGVTFDTAGGRFNPLLFAGTYNFGQFPFVGVGPGGGELTVVSPNLTPSVVPHSRVGFFAGTYDGNAISPRTVLGGDFGLPAHEPIFVQDIGLAWVKNATSSAGAHYQTNPLRIPGQLFINRTLAEDLAPIRGFIQTLLTTAISVIDGSTDGNNVNGVGERISLILWGASKYAQNLIIGFSGDDAEEEASGPGLGTTDIDSSDLELVLEGGGGPLQEVGLRWRDVKITQGATITVAHIQFEADDTGSGIDDMLIFTEDIDDAPIFLDAVGNFNISARTKATPGIAWSPPDWLVVQDRLAAQLTPDISARVQDVVDRGGWAAGNSLVAIITEDPAGTFGEREAESENAGIPVGRNTAMLQVAWDNGALDTGISIFEYRGTGVVSQMMHGLDAVPELMAVKRASDSGNWQIYHSLIQTALPAPEDGFLAFNTDAAASDSATVWNDTAPGATFLTVGTAAAINAHEDDYVGWAMRELEGYSKLFRYVGTGASTGPKIYCGFKPRMVVIKRADGVGSWVFHHRGNAGATLSVDGLFNQMSGNGYLDVFAVFNNDDNIRVYANGFLVGDSTDEVNAVGSEYVGFAFAEAPYQSAKAAR